LPAPCLAWTRLHPATSPTQTHRAWPGPRLAWAPCHQAPPGLDAACREEIKRLRNLGMMTVERLKDCQRYVGQGVPFHSVTTAAQLRDLLDWAEAHPGYKNTLQTMFNMRVRCRGAGQACLGARCLVYTVAWGRQLAGI